MVGPDAANGEPERHDVIVVGGGPSGLSAALVLGRCRRRVLVIDSGRPRNAAARAMHGYLSRDGLPPGQLLRIGREEIERYGVGFIAGEVSNARHVPSGDPHAGASPGLFEVETTRGERFRSRKLLLATGVRDVLPAVEGAATYYGRGVHHCPYCDGWEHRDGQLVAYGPAHAAVGLALALRTWSDRVTACTDGDEVEPDDLARLDRNGIALRTEPLARLRGRDDQLAAIEFESGPSLPCDALFFNTGQLQRSHLPALLGCEHDDDQQIRTHGKQRTCVPGLFLAGDADGDVQFVIVAAAEGARAAVAINRELQDEDRGEPRVDPAATHVPESAGARCPPRR